MQENTEKPGGTQRIKIIAYWVFTGIVALETAAGAQWDLARNDFVRKLSRILDIRFTCSP